MQKNKKGGEASSEESEAGANDFDMEDCIEAGFNPFQASKKGKDLRNSQKQKFKEVNLAKKPNKIVEGSIPTIDSGEGIMRYVVQPELERYPVCIAWYPLPFWRYFLPFNCYFGSIGIGDLSGNIHFARNNSKVFKYLPLDLQNINQN